jgi:glycosyltransferase involved in cell wall biosynthesis
MSAAPATLSAASSSVQAPLDVLTLTPFYPSAGDETEGCFIAEPLAVASQFSIRNHVLAVRPFYRAKVKPGLSDFPVHWRHFLCLPGNKGLPYSGSFLYAGIARQVRRIFEARETKVIHAHGALPCGYAAKRVQEAFGTPFVVTVHGLDAFSSNQVRGYAGERALRASRAVYESAQRVICVSGKVRERVLECAPKAKTCVVYNGVNTDMFCPGVESPSRNIILSVGNLIPIKGHELLLWAFARVHSIFPSATLHIVGDGPERSRLAQLAQQLGISKRTHLLGRRTRQQVAQAMQECAVFALPSRYEALGCVYLEAMSCAKPAIGCYGQGIEEVIRAGVNGWLIHPDCVEELEHALITLLRNPRLRNELGAEARKTMTRGFSITDQARQLAEIYRESRG